MGKITDGREEWGPVQLRAARDENLDRLDLRVLILIASRDRFGGNGRGCSLSPKQMALELHVHEKSVSRSIGNLASRKYIGSEKRSDRRLKEYFVLYDGAAETVESAEIIESGSVAYRVTKPQKSVTSQVTDSAYIGNTVFSNLLENHDVAEDNKSCETLSPNRSYETGRHPPEGAAPRIGAAITAISLDQAIAYFPNAPSFGDRHGYLNVGGFLAWLDRRMRARQCTSDEINAGMEIAEMVFDTYDNGSPEYGVAYRILQTDLEGEVEAGYDG
ncbi:hypothetical protein [Rhizobium leguminosarum]|uniref:hypothetical protein n=1 Tax=Rhizobium leguminosarum TaxID=384 RepID=UPI003F9B3438